MPLAERVPDQKQMIIVADDGGFHPAINRGIQIAAERSAITDVDLMQGFSPSGELVKVLQDYPGIGLGLHIYLPDEDDFTNIIKTYWYRLLPNEDIRKKVLGATERQMKAFQDERGQNPSHVSTHGHLHLNHFDFPFPWFIEQIQELTGEDPNVVIRGHQTVPIRHTRLREAIYGKKPLNPGRFKKFLENMKVSPDTMVELITHPAIVTEGSRPSSVFDATLRQRDLLALLAIMDEDIPCQVGFAISYPGSRRSVSGRNPTADFFNRYAPRFDRIYRSPSIIDKLLRISMKTRMELTMEKIEPIEGKRILDLGCGTGAYDIELAKLGAEYVLGIDFAQGMLDIAQSRAKQEGLSDKCLFVLANFSQLPLSDDEKFDNSIVTGVMDYVNKQRPFVESVLQHTKSKAFFSFPKESDPLAFQRRIRYQNRCPLYYYSLNQVKDLFSDLNCEKEITDIGREYFVEASFANNQ